GVRRETIERALTSDRPLQSDGIAGRREERTGANRGAAERNAQPKRDRSLGAERELIHFLLRDASRLEAAARVLEPRHFADPQIREIYEWLLTDGQNREMLSAEAMSALTVIEDSEREFGEGDRAFEDIVADLQIRPLMAREKR